MGKEQRILWLDVETTGLDPGKDVLLEVAAWSSRSEDPLDLRAEDARTWVLKRKPEDVAARLSPFTWSMHCDNGLLREMFGEGAQVTDFENMLLDLMVLIGVPRDRMFDRHYRPEHLWKLAGNSVHFDRSFLPSGFVALLSHQHLDVSSHLITARAYGDKPEKQPPAHRALDDVGQSVAAYAEFVFRNMYGSDLNYDRYVAVKAEVAKLGKPTAEPASGAV